MPTKEHGVLAYINKMFFISLYSQRISGASQCISPLLHEEDHVVRAQASWAAPTATKHCGKQKAPPSTGTQTVWLCCFTVSLFHWCPLRAICSTTGNPVSDSIDVTRCLLSDVCAFHVDGHQGFPASSGISVWRFQSGHAKSKNRRASVRSCFHV